LDWLDNASGVASGDLNGGVTHVVNLIMVKGVKRGDYWNEAE
jgi:hypothetical protein